MHPAANQVRELVGATLSAAGELRALLDEERAQLAGGHAEALQELIERKVELLQQLERQERQRQQLLAQAGLAPGAEGMKRLAGADAELGRQWEQLLGQLRELQVLNEANGGIIRKQMGRVEQSLGVLTGHCAAGNVYDGRGAHAGGSRGREIDRA